MERRLRYSERKRLAETGSLGPVRAEATPALRGSVLALLQAVAATDEARARGLFATIKQWCRENYGWGPSVDHLQAIETAEFLSLIGDEEHEPLEVFLDICEVFVEEATREEMVEVNWGGTSYPIAIFPTAEARLNEIFDRHRFAYRMRDNRVERIESPALAGAVVGPTLLAAQRPGWEQVEKSYREALRHQRGGIDEQDDSITAAHAALEAAMKAAGLRGNEFGQLTQALRKSNLVPSQLVEVPDLLDKLLKRSAAVRNTMGDAHGKAPGAKTVPRALASLAVHWTGAFIVYLAAVVEDQQPDL